MSALGLCVKIRIVNDDCEGVNVSVSVSGGDHPAGRE